MSLTAFGIVIAYRFHRLAVTVAFIRKFRDCNKALRAEI